MQNKKSTLVFTAIVLLIAIAAAVAVIPPIAQDQSYHNFYDQRTIFGIPHCFNVVSNIFFILIGLVGVFIVLVKPKWLPEEELSTAWGVFYAGLIFTGIGSSWYHINPGNFSLVWDRLPMTIVFMSFFSIIIADYISLKAGKALLWPLVYTGLASVFYWIHTEQNAQGNLVPYALVQFLPMILIPFIVIFFKPTHLQSKAVWIMAIFYVLAKAFELLDGVQIYGGFYLNGHPLKHISAALAPVAITLSLMQRQITRIKTQ